MGATRATVRTTLALERQGQVQVEYHLLPSGNTRWRVHDVLVDRRSLVTGYREYFDKALAGSSYQDLIWKLRLKEVELSPAAESRLAPTPRERPAAARPGGGGPSPPVVSPAAR